MNPDQELLSANLKKANPDPRKVAYEFERNRAPASLEPIQEAPASLTFLSGAPTPLRPDAEPMALFEGSPLEKTSTLDVRPETESKDAPSDVSAEKGLLKRTIGQSMMNYAPTKMNVALKVKDTPEPDPLRGTPASHGLPAPPTTASLFQPEMTGVDSKANMRLTVSSQDRVGTVFKGVHTRLVHHVAEFLKGLSGGTSVQKIGVASFLVDSLVTCHDNPQGFDNMHKQSASLEFSSPLCTLLKRSHETSKSSQGGKPNAVSGAPVDGLNDPKPVDSSSLLYLKIHLLTTCFGAGSENEHLQAAYNKYLSILQLVMNNRLRWGVKNADLETYKNDLTSSDAFTLFRPAYAFLASVGLSQSLTHVIAGVQWVSLIKQGKTVTEAALYTLGTCRLLTEMQQLPMIPSYLFDIAVLSEAASVSVYTFQTAVGMLTGQDRSQMTMDIVIQLRSLWVDISEAQFKTLLGVSPPQGSGLTAMSAVGSVGIKSVQQGPFENYNNLMVGLFQQLLHIPNVRHSVVPVAEVVVAQGMRLVFIALLISAVGIRILQEQRRYTGAMQMIMGTRRTVSDLLGRYAYIMRLIRGFNTSNGDMIDESIPLMETELIWLPENDVEISTSGVQGGGASGPVAVDKNTMTPEARQKKETLDKKKQANKIAKMKLKNINMRKNLVMVGRAVEIGGEVNAAGGDQADVNQATNQALFGDLRLPTAADAIPVDQNLPQVAAPVSVPVSASAAAVASEAEARAMARSKAAVQEEEGEEEGEESESEEGEEDESEVEEGVESEVEEKEEEAEAKAAAEAEAKAATEAAAAAKKAMGQIAEITLEDVSKMSDNKLTIFLNTASECTLRQLRAWVAKNVDKDEQKKYWLHSTPKSKKNYLSWFTAFVYSVSGQEGKTDN